MIQPEEVTKVLDTYAILDEMERRKDKYAERDAWYELLTQYYYRHNAKMGEGLPILAANAQGRPLLRQVGETMVGDRTYSTQRLAPIVDDYSSLMGRMPTSRVEPPDPSPQGEARAELLTKFLYSTYELSRMDYQQALSGHYLSLFGDSVYVLEPDSDNLRVVWNVQNPGTCWPSFYHGYRRFEVYDLIIAEVWETEDLVRQLNVHPDRDSEDARTVVTYISPHQRTVIAGLKTPVRVAHADWDLDFCPAVWVFNRVTGAMGMSDIGSSLDQQDFLDFMMNVFADGIIHMTYPILGVKNPANMGQDQIVLGPGAPPVTLQGDGDIIVRVTQGDPKALIAIMQHTQEDILSTTGTSKARQEGAMRSNPTSGRAIQNIQQPQSTRIEFKQQVLGNAIETANRMTLQLQEEAPFLKKFKGPIYGNYKGVSFQDEFDASTDIAGWYRNKVTWQSLVGLSLQQKVATAYEGLQAQLWDDLESREMVGVEDPMGMRKRVEAHKMWEGQLQQKMQQPQQQPQEQGQQAAPALFRPRGVAAPAGGGLTAGALRGAMRGGQ